MSKVLKRIVYGWALAIVGFAFVWVTLWAYAKALLFGDPLASWLIIGAAVVAFTWKLAQPEWL